MLPFLKQNQDAGGNGEDDHVKRAPDSTEYGTLDAVADDMMEAVKSGDSARLKSALESLVDHIQGLDMKQDEQL